LLQPLKICGSKGLLSDIKVTATKINGDRIFLNFELSERPRLSKFAFSGISKNEADKLRDKLQLVKGKVITENLIQVTKNQVKDYYVEKGFLFVETTITTEKDTIGGT
jgi:outer membrane protein insertion porin family